MCWMFQVLWQIYQSFEKRKKISKPSLNNNTYHCPYCLDETKEKALVVPSFIQLFFVKEMRFLIVYIHMIICWSLLSITYHHCLRVSYWPKYLHTGKAFNYYSFILLGFLVGTVFTTTVYIFNFLCTYTWEKDYIFPKQPVLWCNQFLEG